MEHLLSIGVSNAVAAVVLALVAATVCRIYRRPALTHALWLLVLVKLVTPPIWTVPVTWVQGGSGPEPKAKTSPEPAPKVSTPVIALSEEELRRIQELGALRIVETEPNGAEPAEAITPEHEARPAAPTPPVPVRGASLDVSLAAGAVWLGGTLLFLTVALARVGRFRRVLAYATRAPADVDARARRIARRMGLNSAPGVWFVPGAVCPMLWAAGGPARLLVPAGLWERLDPDQRDTLLAHELAHLRRRDHWVRPLELLATALYWWHPAVWWARYELREAEEQCCDAWVVWSLPGSLRHYMNALLEAVEYVSEGFDLSARPTTPALASGMGQFQHLKRRLLMMKHSNVIQTRSLTWAGFAAVCGVAALLLPLAPSFAQQQQPQPEKATPADVREDVTVERQDDATPADPAAGDEDAARSPDVRTDVVVTQKVPVLSEIPIVGDLFQNKISAGGRVTVVGEDGTSEISADRLVLDKAGNRITLDGGVLALSRGDKTNENENDNADDDDNDGPKGGADAKARDAEVRKARAEVQRLSKELERAARRLADLETKRAMGNLDAQMKQMKAANMNFRVGVTVPEGMNLKDQAKLRRMSEALRARVGAKDAAVRAERAGGDDAMEQRLNAMEKHLDQLMQEMKQLRSEGKDRQKQKDKERKDKGDKASDDHRPDDKPATS